MKLSSIILGEANYIPYRGMVQVVSQSESPSRIADLIRALPGVTTCTIAHSDDAANTVTFKVKLITQKSGEEAFQSLKKNALQTYTDINVFRIAPKSLERMKLPGEY